MTAFLTTFVLAGLYVSGHLSHPQFSQTTNILALAYIVIIGFQAGFTHSTLARHPDIARLWTDLSKIASRPWERAIYLLLGITQSNAFLPAIGSRFVITLGVIALKYAWPDQTDPNTTVFGLCALLIVIGLLISPRKLII